MIKKILIIEDELAIADLMSYALEKEEYIVRTVDNRIEWMGITESFKLNLIIFDLMLPDISRKH
ncbi:response regulator [Clostridium botulinum]|uniref:response regulator n=1 Tax=Clostridium botulinum TaxID=1491 RepID=UPI0027DBB73A|nr:response regulator [Clostridium botulinum]